MVPSCVRAVTSDGWMENYRSSPMWSKGWLPLCLQCETIRQICNVQSQNYCFIVQMLLGKDSKKVYMVFKSLFGFCDKLMEQGLPASTHGPVLKPFKTVTPHKTWVTYVSASIPEVPWRRKHTFVTFVHAHLMTYSTTRSETIIVHDVWEWELTNFTIDKWMMSQLQWRSFKFPWKIRWATILWCMGHHWTLSREVVW